ncbi:MAG: hypothetical protein KDB80_12125, partial [Planctomycetes bacterium]|nr:hypothetical protein [Planctomycetota bacterium]
FSGLPSDCIDCHLADYQGADDPNHVSGSFPQDCTQCHSTVSFSGATFDHTASFPLTGAHTSVACTTCHVGNVYSGLPSDCIDCHLADYQSADDHVAGGFSQDCTQCHSTFSFESAEFTHTQAFPLTGAHASVDCSTCHVGNVYQNLPSNCIDCHLADYQGADGHVAGGFSQDCTQCHSTVTFEGAGFTHTSAFPLIGSHAAASCSQCHVGNVYQGLPSDCSDCHMPEYTAATDPPHAAQGFGTDCATCHTPTTWEGAEFNHQFPIDTGDHRNLACVDCHTTPGNSTVFSCTHCHEHRQSEMADEHDEVGGYVWSSPACYACHPDGRD